MDKNLKGTEILNYFPFNIRKLFDFLDNSIWSEITNIRMNCNGPLMIELGAQRRYLSHHGVLNTPDGAYNISRKDINAIFEMITASSVYTYSRYINNGFITLSGANRVGLVGNCTVENDKIKSVNEIYSLNFRISHEKPGIAEPLLDFIYKDKTFKNTLIISPPGCGKTTLLRDIARIIGSDNKKTDTGICAVIDERYELACSVGGKSQLDIGTNNILMSGCPKHIAVPIVVRSMCPDVIVVDEMCSHEDYKSALFAKQSGCAIIASVHGKDENINELTSLNGVNFFETVIVLSKRKGVGTIEKILGG